ncbi:MAG TPA: glycosyl hydrolase [Patescibacteria group bacterium]|nr:glycosyl hydrolase [Patescibacteria group bacterium]
MSPKIVSFLFFVVVLIFSTIILQTNNKTKVNLSSQVSETPRKPVYTGAWVGGFWDNETKTLDIQPLKQFEATIDKKVAFANLFSEWEYLANPQLRDNLNTISANGWTPIISANPSFIDNCEDKGKPLYATIADGSCDTFLAKVGKNMKAYNRPLFLRFAWEMNLKNMYWSVEGTKSTPQDFIHAWQRFHTILKREGATNVVWILSFNTSSSETIPYADLYPGDEYVDWVAIDGYNWGTSQPWSGWTNFSGVFWNSYSELIAVSKKPVMLSEVNSSPTGGNKAAWFDDMLTEKIPDDYPQIEAIVFFNENKMTGESVDWRIEKSPEYVEAVRSGLTLPIYKSTYP